MEIEIKENPTGLTVLISGRLDTLAALSAQKDFAQISESADKTIVFDCSKLEYISSSGLRLFLALRKKTMEKQGKIIIENINSEINKVFMMTGFINLFDIK